jgi:hypothetical protein
MRTIHATPPLIVFWLRSYERFAAAAIGIRASDSRFAQRHAALLSCAHGYAKHLISL